MQENKAQQGFTQVSAAVAGVGALARGRLAVEGLASAGAASAVSLVGGVALCMALTPEGWLRALIGALWLGASGAVIWWRWLRPAQRWHDLHAVGREIEARFPELRNDVTASLEFGRTLEPLRQEGRLSVAMIERLLAQTGERVHALGERVREASPPLRLKAPAGVMVGAAAALLLMGAVAPEATLRGVRGLLLGPELPVEADEGRARVALVGDLLLRFEYPAYTGLGQQLVQNSTGEVEALKGTQIEVEGIALRPVQRAELVLTLEGAPPTPAEAAQGAPAGDQGSPAAAPTQTTERIVLQRRPGGRLVASFTALRGGSYTIEATLEDGTLAYDGVTRPIRVLPDESPRLEVARPVGEVDVSPQDQVTFSWTAGDDFGLSEVAIVTAFAGKEEERKRSVIFSADQEEALLPGDARPVDPEPGAALREKSGEYVLDLTEHDLQPRDQLVVYLEAVDNDAITGPKITASPPVVLKVSSPEDKHLELIQSQEELFEALLSLLGDYLERPVGDWYAEANGARVEGVPPTWAAQELSARFQAALGPFEAAGAVLEKMGALTERMQQDPLMLKRDYELFVQAHKELVALREAEGAVIDRLRPASIEERLTRPQSQQLFGARAATIKGTERAIITIEDLIASQRMENLLDTAKSLQEAKDRLKELLQKYKETQDPALRAEIMRQMQRIRERMREVAQKMQAQIKNLPSEHMNLEALERKEMAQKASDAADAMEKMMKALEEGDMDTALAMMEQMDKDIDAMLSEMEGEFEEMKPEGLSELDKKVSEVMDQLNDLESQEREIAQKTDEVTREIEQQHRQQMEQQLSEVEAQARAKVNEIREQLSKADPSRLGQREREEFEAAQRRVEELDQALERRDVAQAADKAQQLSQELERAQFGLEFQKGAMRRDDPRRAGLQQAEQSVKRAQPRAAELERDLQRLMQQAGQPQPSPEQSQRLQELQQQQGQARGNAQKLQQQLQQSGQDFPMLQELEPGLQEAQQYMEGAQQRLQESQGRKAHENEKLAMDRLGDLKESLKQALKKERMGGQSGQQQQGKQISRDKVKIPGRDGQAPREFREDIMDAMKESGLEDYSGELKAYYESLVK